MIDDLGIDQGDREEAIFGGAIDRAYAPASIPRRALAAFRQNFIGGMADLTVVRIGERLKADSDFDPSVFDDAFMNAHPLFKAKPHKLIGLRSVVEAEALHEQMTREDEDRFALGGGSGLLNFAMELAAGVASPENLIPLGMALRTKRGLMAMARAGSRAGALGGAISEVGLQATQERRTAIESALAIAASSAFGGAIGAGAYALSPLGRETMRMQSKFMVDSVTDDLTRFTENGRLRITPDAIRARWNTARAELGLAPSKTIFSQVGGVVREARDVLARGWSEGRGGPPGKPAAPRTPEPTVASEQSAAEGPIEGLFDTRPEARGKLKPDVRTEPDPALITQRAAAAMQEIVDVRVELASLEAKIEQTFKTIKNAERDVFAAMGDEDTGDAAAIVLQRHEEADAAVRAQEAAVLERTRQTRLAAEMMQEVPDAMILPSRPLGPIGGGSPEDPIRVNAEGLAEAVDVDSRIQAMRWINTVVREKAVRGKRTKARRGRVVGRTKQGLQVRFAEGVEVHARSSLLVEMDGQDVKRVRGHQGLDRPVYNKSVTRTLPSGRTESEMMQSAIPISDTDALIELNRVHEFMAAMNRASDDWEKRNRRTVEIEKSNKEPLDLRDMNETRLWAVRSPMPVSAAQKRVDDITKQIAEQRAAYESAAEPGDPDAFIAGDQRRLGFLNDAKQVLAKASEYQAILDDLLAKSARYERELSAHHLTDEETRELVANLGDVELAIDEIRFLDENGVLEQRIIDTTKETKDKLKKMFVQFEKLNEPIIGEATHIEAETARRDVEEARLQLQVAELADDLATRENFSFRNGIGIVVDQTVDESSWVSKLFDIRRDANKTRAARLGTVQELGNIITKRGAEVVAARADAIALLGRADAKEAVSALADKLALFSSKNVTEITQRAEGEMDLAEIRRLGQFALTKQQAKNFIWDMVKQARSSAKYDSDLAIADLAVQAVHARVLKAKARDDLATELTQMTAEPTRIAVEKALFDKGLDPKRLDANKIDISSDSAEQVTVRWNDKYERMVGRAADAEDSVIARLDAARRPGAARGREDLIADIDAYRDGTRRPQKTFEDGTLELEPRQVSGYIDPDMARSIAHDLDVNTEDILELTIGRDEVEELEAAMPAIAEQVRIEDPGGIEAEIAAAEAAGLTPQAPGLPPVGPQPAPPNTASGAPAGGPPPPAVPAGPPTGFNHNSQRAHFPTLVKLMGMPHRISRKLLAFSPKLRAMMSDLDSVRMVTMTLFDNNLHVEGQGQGVVNFHSIEDKIGSKWGFVEVKILRELQKGWGEDWAIHRGPGTKARSTMLGQRVAGLGQMAFSATGKQGLTYTYWLKRLTRALRNDGVDLEADGIAKMPGVERVAKMIRKELLDPALQEMVQLGMLKKGLRREFSDSYFTRVWNVEHMTANEAQWIQMATAFLVRDASLTHGAASKKAAAMFEAITAGPEGRLSEADFHGRRQRTAQERSVYGKDSEWSDSGFLIDDADIVLRYWFRTVPADIELARLDTFFTPARVRAHPRWKPDPQLRRTLVVAKRHALDQIQRETVDGTPERARMMAQLAKFFGTAAQPGDLHRFVQLTRRTYGMPADPSAPLYRMSVVARGFNALTDMGAFGLSQLPDIARPVMVLGIRRVYGTGIRTFFTELQTMKVNREEADLAGAVSDWWTNRRTLEMLDLGQGYGHASMGERMLRKAVDEYAIWSGLVHINMHLKRWSAAMQSQLIIDHARLAAEGLHWDGRAASAKEVFTAKAELARAKISEPMAQRIWAQVANNPTSGRLRTVGTEAWSDMGAKEIFRASLRSAVDSTINTPKLGERPFFMSRELGRNIFQYRSFALSSIAQTLVPGLQAPGFDWLIGAGMAVGMGGLSIYMKALAGGWPMPDLSTEEGLNHFIRSAVDRSGIAGVYGDMNNWLGFVTRGEVAVGRAFNDRADPSFRFSNRDIVTETLGPTASNLKDFGKAASGLLNAAIYGEQPPTRAYNALRNITPLNNHFLLNRTVFRPFYENFERQVRRGLAEELHGDRIPRRELR